MPAAVTLRVLALERRGPGTLHLHVDYESAANEPQSLKVDRRRTFLVDDTGYEWHLREPPVERQLLQDTKARAAYVFSRTTEGKDSIAASMQIEFVVRGSRGSKPAKCRITVNGVPIRTAKS